MLRSSHRLMTLATTLAFAAWLAVTVVHGARLLHPWDGTALAALARSSAPWAVGVIVLAVAVFLIRRDASGNGAVPQAGQGNPTVLIQEAGATPLSGRTPGHAPEHGTS